MVFELGNIAEAKSAVGRLPITTFIGRVSRQKPSFLAVLKGQKNLFFFVGAISSDDLRGFLAVIF